MGGQAKLTNKCTMYGWTVSDFVGKVNQGVYNYLVGKMRDDTAKVDEKGRVIIPKDIRETVNLKEGTYVTIKTRGKAIIMGPLEPVADKYFGAFKVTTSPENLHEFIVEVIKKWWTTQPT
jgi:AbrB family looped-hinge helix DNA binding protein